MKKNRMKLKGMVVPGLLALLMIVLPLSSFAEVQLTQKWIEKWLEATPKIEEFGKKHEKALADPETDEESFEEAFDVDNMIKPVREAGLYDELEDLVAEYGFDSPEDWAAVTGKITKAVMAIQTAGHRQAMGSEMEEQMEAMKNNPDLTPEAKQLMKESMDQSMGMMKSLQQVPESDKKLVEPYLPQMMQLLDQGEGEE